MTNVRVMHGEYWREQDYDLFGYTYIPKDKPEGEKKGEEKSIQSKRELYKGFVFREVNK